jgi:hypothetical protein
MTAESNLTPTTPSLMVISFSITLAKMHSNFPNELLSEVLSYLVTPKQKSRLGNDWLHDIAQARLVCRRWNQVASKHLLSTLVLWHTSNTADAN